MLLLAYGQETKYTLKNLCSWKHMQIYFEDTMLSQKALSVPSVSLNLNFTIELYDKDLTHQTEQSQIMQNLTPTTMN
jgi:hypothetical protein